MEQERIEEAAERLATARLQGGRVERLPPAVRPIDEAMAYRIQEALHARLEAAGRGPLAGFKIGCTTTVMQRYLGIDNPCAGGLLAIDLHPGHARLRADTFLRPGVECELAVRLGRDLAGGPATFDRRSVAAAVEAVMAAIEIVDDRYAGFRSFDTPTLIADDFFNAGGVLGPPVTNWQELDLAGLRGRMAIDDEPVGEGRGGDILGHPLAALAWLAQLRARMGRPLRAGTIVLLGSIVQTVWLRPGSRVDIAIDDLGSASAVLT